MSTWRSRAAVVISLAGGPCPATSAATYTAEAIHIAGQPVYALASGDLDPAAAGDEVVLLLGDGDVVLLHRVSGTWAPQPLHQGRLPFAVIDIRQRTTLDVVDVRPDVSGLEVVAYASNTLHVLFEDEVLGWRSESVDDTLPDMFGLGWGARPGEIDPSFQGLEIFLIFEGVGDLSSGTLYGRDANGWASITPSPIYSAEVGMDAAFGGINPEWPGNEIIVATEMGPTYEIVRPADPSSTPWPSTIVWDDFDNAAWVLEIVDLDPALSGNEIVYGARYSDRIMMSTRQPDGTHVLQTLHTGIVPPGLTSIWDIAVADLAQASPALEVLGVDDSGSLYFVRQVAEAWQGSIIFQDAGGPLHAVVAGDFDPASAGFEIVTAGQGGVVTMLARAFSPDTNGDGVVDVVDLVNVILAWGSADPAADVNGDGVVDILDFIEVILAWGPQPR